jgi:hypothetical protein
MSAEQLQSGLLQLVRYPESFRLENGSAFISSFDLTKKEQNQLRLLAESQFVSNFGKERRWKRFRTYILHVFPLTVKSIGIEKAKRIFNYQFDLNYPVLELSKITHTFYSFFMAQEGRLRSEFKYPAFVADILRYEFAEYTFHWSLSESLPNIHKDSVLNPNIPFVMLDFQYDIGAFVEQTKGLDEVALSTLAPEKISNIILFIKIFSAELSEDYSLSQFNIDEELQLFLKQQLKHPPEKATAYPSCYSDLVEIGLCKPKIEE